MSSEQQICPRARAKQTVVNLQEQMWALSAAIMRVSMIDGLRWQERDAWKRSFNSIHSYHGRLAAAELHVQMGMHKCVSEGLSVDEFYRLIEYLGALFGQSTVSHARDTSGDAFIRMSGARGRVCESVVLLISDLHRIEALPAPEPEPAHAIAA